MRYYVPEAQGGLPPGPHARYVLGARTRLGRTVRTAYPLVVTPQVPGEDLATSAARAPPGVGMWYLPEKNVREQAVNNDLFK